MALSQPHTPLHRRLHQLPLPPPRPVPPAPPPSLPHKPKLQTKLAIARTSLIFKIHPVPTAVSYVIRCPGADAPPRQIRVAVKKRNVTIVLLGLTPKTKYV